MSHVDVKDLNTDQLFLWQKRQAVADPVIYTPINGSASKWCWCLGTNAPSKGSRPPSLLSTQGVRGGSGLRTAPNLVSQFLPYSIIPLHFSHQSKFSSGGRSKNYFISPFGPFKTFVLYAKYIFKYFSVIFTPPYFIYILLIFCNTICCRRSFI